MSRYDVIVIGAGPAGLTAGALLAQEGRSVLVLERSEHLGGRGLAVEDEGFKLNLGGHLIEDSGSGITRVFERVGKSLPHGKVNAEMPVWQDGRWASVRDLYAGSRSELKKVVAALLELSPEELDRWDDRPLREWMLLHTRDEGVIALWEYLALLECLTDRWTDHAASDNLFMRRLHYEEKRMAGYSFWPEQGWDGMFADLRDAVVEHGGEVRLSTAVDRVLIEGGAVTGVACARPGRAIPNDREHDVIEASCVISTLPVWDVLDVVPETQLPDWYAAQIRFLAQDAFRCTWLGLYLATEEPVTILAPEELASWTSAPLTGTAGFFFNTTVLEPAVSPPGTQLYVAGAVIPAARARDAVYVDGMFEQFEAELKLMLPGLERSVWRRRHLVFDPTYGVIQKPGLVGRYRPHWDAPGVEGLLFASETFRSRGIGVDRAARAALTAVEHYLGRRLPGFDGTWRY
jgi:phytoene dehydrogenase-like protein